MFKTLFDIQQELKVGKDKFNKFGNFRYRSVSDIIEAVKPLLKSHNCVLKKQDDLVQLGNRYYLKVTVSLVNAEGDSIDSVAYAREPDCKAKMDESQTTGSASSYAWKYALNGLFAIEDTDDTDGKDNAKKPIKPETLAGYLRKKGVKDGKGFAVQYGVKSTEDAQKLLQDKGALDSLIEEFKSLNPPKLP